MDNHKPKLLVITLTTKNFMPYFDKYETLFDNDLEISTIQWNRIKDKNIKIYNAAKESSFYIDKKNSHRRNPMDYLKYSLFIKKVLKKNNFDKIIFFGVHIPFFIQNYLIKNYKYNFIIDIRDHNYLYYFFKMKRLIDATRFTVISSNGFKEWLPKSNRYIISHNAPTEILQSSKTKKQIKEHKIVNISYIGILRDFKVNQKLIIELSNNPNFHLIYHGQGYINKELENIINQFDIKNITLKGYYKKSIENQLYEEATMINVLIDDSNINNKTLLPNRLYLAVMNEKPILTLKGTYLSEIVEKYNLGLCLESIENSTQEIMDYLSGFKAEEFTNGRNKFLNDIDKDNINFKESINRFMRETIHNRGNL